MSARDVMANASRSKLLLWRTIVVSYAEWVRHFPDVMRATGFWIALLSLTMGVADWLSWSIAMSTIAELKSGAPKDPGVRIVVTGILSVFSATVFVLAVVDVAISWHRRVILSEVPKLFGRNLGNTYYWRYFGRLLIVSVVAAAPIALLFLLIAMDIDFEVSVELEIVVPVMASLLLVMTLVIFARISLVLPAEATLRQRLRWTESLRLTRGNTWRFAIGLFACGIAPGWLLSELLEWGGLVRSTMSPIEILITEGTPDAWIKGAIRSQVLVAGVLTMLPIGVGFLSHCYQQCVRI